MTNATLLPSSPAMVGALQIVPFAHPQGCRTYVVADPLSKQALAIDVHLDLVAAVADHLAAEGWTLPYVLDTHTHADHPSGAGVLASRFESTRLAHPLAKHAGVDRHPEDRDRLKLGDQAITIRHAPGHTPDHMAVLTEGALFSGDSLFIGGVARADFLGGDAGLLYDTLQSLLDGLGDETIVYPGHDYQQRIQSTVGQERADNPWLAMNRDDFVKHLTANPPPRPANMDDLLRFNRHGVDIPPTIDAEATVRWVEAGGAGSIIDCRSGAEFDGQHLKGSRLIPLDQLTVRADDVRATPAPRLLLCRTGRRATTARAALESLNIGGLMVVTGGIVAYEAAGGETEKQGDRLSLERQVRITAGALVVLGSVLGYFVHPAFLALPAFVGAGLVFAGITDWCGMGLLMAKMPYNRSRTADGGGAPAGGCAATAPPAGCAATPPADE